MKRKMLTAIMIVSLLTVCVVPSISQVTEFPHRTEIRLIESVKKWSVPLPNDKKAFAEAVKEGSIAKVKKIMSDFPAFDFLNYKIPVEDGKSVYPVCIAAANGRTELLKYIYQQKEDNRYWYCFDWDAKDLFDVALENNHIDTVKALMDLKYPIRPKLMTIVRRITDKSTLETIIPLVLDAGEDYKNTSSTLDCRFDSFYKAAENKNINYIVVLRDELKRRGIQDPVAQYIYVSCPGYDRSDVLQWKEMIENKEEIHFLKKYGIKTHIDVTSDSRGCD